MTLTEVINGITTEATKVSIIGANGVTNGHNGAINGDSKKPRQRSQLQPSLDVAISPNDPSKIPSTIESIRSLGNAYSATDDAVRRQLLAEARQLVRALETPRETMIKHNWAQVSVALTKQKEPQANHPSLPHTWPSPSVSTSVSLALCWRTTLRRRRSPSLQRLSTWIQRFWVSSPQHKLQA
jgi:hypothetical protein